MVLSEILRLGLLILPRQTTFRANNTDAIRAAKAALVLFLWVSPFVFATALAQTQSEQPDGQPMQQDDTNTASVSSNSQSPTGQLAPGALTTQGTTNPNTYTDTATELTTIAQQAAENEEQLAEPITGWVDQQLLQGTNQDQVGGVNTYSDLKQFWSNDIVGNLFNNMGQLIGKWATEWIHGWVVPIVQYLTSCLRVFVLNPNIAINGMQGSSAQNDDISGYVRQAADVMYGIAVDLLLLLFILCIWKFWVEQAWRGGAHAMSAIGRLIFTSGILLAWPTIYAFWIEISNEMIHAIYFNSADQVQMLDVAMSKAIEGGIAGSIFLAGRTFAPVLGAAAVPWVGGLLGGLVSSVGLILFLLLSGTIILQLTYILVLKATQTALLTAQYMFAPIFLVCFAVPDTERAATGYVQAFVEVSIWTFVWVGLLKIMVILMFSDFNPWGKVLTAIGILQIMTQVPTFIARAGISPASHILEELLVGGFAGAALGASNALQGFSMEKLGQFANWQHNKDAHPLNKPAALSQELNVPQSGPPALQEMNNLARGLLGQDKDGRNLKAGQQQQLNPHGPPRKTGDQEQSQERANQQEQQEKQLQNQAGHPEASMTPSERLAAALRGESLPNQANQRPLSAVNANAPIPSPDPTTNPQNLAEHIAQLNREQSQRQNAATKNPAQQQEAHLAPGQTTAGNPQNASQTQVVPEQTATTSGAQPLNTLSVQGNERQEQQKGGAHQSVRQPDSASTNPESDSSRSIADNALERVRANASGAPKTIDKHGSQVYGGLPGREFDRMIRESTIPQIAGAESTQVRGNWRDGVTSIMYGANSTEEEQAAARQVAGIATDLRRDPSMTEAARRAASKNLGGGVANAIADNFVSNTGGLPQFANRSRVARHEQEMFRATINGLSAWMRGEEGNEVTEEVNRRYGPANRDGGVPLASNMYHSMNPLASAQSGWNMDYGAIKDFIGAQGGDYSAANRGSAANVAVRQMRRDMQGHAFRGVAGVLTQLSSDTLGADAPVHLQEAYMQLVGRGISEDVVFAAAAVHEAAPGQVSDLALVQRVAQLGSALSGGSPQVSQYQAACSRILVDRKARSVVSGGGVSVDTLAVPQVEGIQLGPHTAFINEQSVGGGGYSAEQLVYLEGNAAQQSFSPASLSGYVPRVESAPANATVRFIPRGTGGTAYNLAQAINLDANSGSNLPPRVSYSGGTGGYASDRNDMVVDAYIRYQQSGGGPDAGGLALGGLNQSGWHIKENAQQIQVRLRDAGVPPETLNNEQNMEVLYTLMNVSAAGNNGVPEENIISAAAHVAQAMPAQAFNADNILTVSLLMESNGDRHYSPAEICAARSLIENVVQDTDSIEQARYVVRQGNIRQLTSRPDFVPNDNGGGNGAVVERIARVYTNSSRNQSNTGGGPSPYSNPNFREQFDPNSWNGTQRATGDVQRPFRNNRGSFPDSYQTDNQDLLF